MSDFIFTAVYIISDIVSGINNFSIRKIKDQNQGRLE